MVAILITINVLAEKVGLLMIKMPLPDFVVMTSISSVLSVGKSTSYNAPFNGNTLATKNQTAHAV